MPKAIAVLLSSACTFHSVQSRIGILEKQLAAATAAEHSTVAEVAEAEHKSQEHKGGVALKKAQSASVNHVAHTTLRKTVSSAPKPSANTLAESVKTPSQSHKRRAEHTASHAEHIALHADEASSKATHVKMTPVGKTTAPAKVVQIGTTKASSNTSQKQSSVPHDLEARFAGKEAELARVVSESKQTAEVLERLEQEIERVKTEAAAELAAQQAKWEAKLRAREEELQQVVAERDQLHAAVSLNLVSSSKQLVALRQNESAQPGSVPAQQAAVTHECVEMYLDSTIGDVLKTALAELCIKRPDDPFKFMSDHLLLHTVHGHK